MAEQFLREWDAAVARDTHSVLQRWLRDKLGIDPDGFKAERHGEWKGHHLPAQQGYHNIDHHNPSVVSAIDMENAWPEIYSAAKQNGKTSGLPASAIAVGPLQVSMDPVSENFFSSNAAVVRISQRYMIGGYETIKGNTKLVVINPT